MHKGALFEWSDLRYFLAVARHGSTLAAAKALKLSQSTVHRRLTELERKVGQDLVTRTPTGYRLTEFGREMLPYAEQVEQAVLAFEAHPGTVARGETGVIRLTCPEPIMARILQSSLLDRFHERYPGLRVEFVMSDKYLDLTKGDADVALRSGDTDDDVLVGRKVADSIWAIYASKSYIARCGQPCTIDELGQHPLVGLDESMTGHRLAKWLRETVPDARIVARVNSVLGLVSAARSGIGVTPLPAETIVAHRSQMVKHGRSGRVIAVRLRQPYHFRNELRQLMTIFIESDDVFAHCKIPVGAIQGWFAFRSCAHDSMDGLLFFFASRAGSAPPRTHCV
jgi:DNA-binding transcriptional LysR family regulator